MLLNITPFCYSFGSCYFMPDISSWETPTEFFLWLQQALSQAHNGYQFQTTSFKEHFMSVNLLTLHLALSILNIFRNIQLPLNTKRHMDTKGYSLDHTASWREDKLAPPHLIHLSFGETVGSNGNKKWGLYSHTPVMHSWELVCTLPPNNYIQVFHGTKRVALGYCTKNHSWIPFKGNSEWEGLIFLKIGFEVYTFKK